MTNEEYNLVARIAMALEKGVKISEEQLKLTHQAMTERKELMESTAENEVFLAAMLKDMGGDKEH